MAYNFGSMLRELRKGANLTQKEVYEKLGVKQSTFSSWERGVNEPPASVLLELCKLYNIGDAVTLLFGDMTEDGNFILNESENQLIQNLRDLPKEVSDSVKELVKKLKQTYSTLKDGLPITSSYSQNVISHPVFLMPASAGTGQFLDSNDYDLVDFPEEIIPRDSNFAVRVSGDSMEPEYPNGSIVFVKQVKTIEPGETGIFILNNEGFLKKLGDSNNLVSINPKYKDIVINKYDNCKLVGKVVGSYNG